MRKRNSVCSIENCAFFYRRVKNYKNDSRRYFFYISTEFIFRYSKCQNIDYSNLAAKNSLCFMQNHELHFFFLSLSLIAKSIVSRLTQFDLLNKYWFFVWFTNEPSRKSCFHLFFIKIPVIAMLSINLTPLQKRYNLFC